MGASARHLVGLAALRLFGLGFPAGTLAVNLLGCLAMGVFIEVLGLRLQGSAALRLLVATGFLGGFTTFSSFSLEAVMLMERREYLTAGAYVLGSVTLSIIALMIGLYLGRKAFL